MSRCRKLSSDISCDKVVARCGRKSLLAALLYTWMIPHLDDWGRITGDPEELGMIVMPGLYQPPEEIDKALQILCEEGLVSVYETDGKRCIAYPLNSFWKYQTYISEKSTRAGSKFPDPPGFVVPQKQESGKVRETAGKGAEVRETAGKGASFSFPSSFKKDLKTKASSFPNQNEGVSPPTPSKQPKKKPTKKPSNASPNGEAFDQFWKAYPRKVDKKDAIRAFAKINPDEGLLSIMLTTIERSKTSRDWTEENGQFIPYPTSWLNGRRWEDEGVEDLRRSPAGQTDLSDYPTEREVDPVALEASRAKLKAIFSDLGQAKAMPQ